MTDPTEEFFDALGRRGHEPLLTEVKGTIRFDLARDHSTDHWFLSICQGDVSVSRAEGAADCVLRTDGALFDRLACGEANAHAAWLRNKITIEGNRPQLIDAFQRILPGPPGAHDPRPAVHHGRASHGG